MRLWKSQRILNNDEVEDSDEKEHLLKDEVEKKKDIPKHDSKNSDDKSRNFFGD